jgi:hypothetical protein
VSAPQTALGQRQPKELFPDMAMLAAIISFPKGGPYGLGSGAPVTTAFAASTYNFSSKYTDGGLEIPARKKAREPRPRKSDVSHVLMLMPNASFCYSGRIARGDLVRVARSPLDY